MHIRKEGELFTVDVKIEIFVLDFFVGTVSADGVNGHVEFFNQLFVLLADSNTRTISQPFGITQLRADELVVLAFGLHQKPV